MLRAELPNDGITDKDVYCQKLTDRKTRPKGTNAVECSTECHPFGEDDIITAFACQ
jgi:hypothetical protein